MMMLGVALTSVIVKWSMTACRWKFGGEKVHYSRSPFKETFFQGEAMEISTSFWS